MVQIYHLKTVNPILTILVPNSIVSNLNSRRDGKLTKMKQNGTKILSQECGPAWLEINSMSVSFGQLKHETNLSH